MTRTLPGATPQGTPFFFFFSSLFFFFNSFLAVRDDWIRGEEPAEKSGVGGEEGA